MYTYYKNKKKESQVQLKYNSMPVSEENQKKKKIQKQLSTINNEMK